MASNPSDADKNAPQSLVERFKSHALGPMGLPSIFREISYAVADIRHKWEEAAYGRAVTPRWNDKDVEGMGGIHGKADTPSVEIAPDDAAGSGGVHGKPDIDPNGGGPVTRHEGGPTGPVYPYTPPAEIMPPEPKGLGMSYAELTGSWEKACLPNPDNPDHGRDQSKDQDHGIDR